SRSRARIFPSTASSTRASLKTGMTMETAPRLAMNLIDGVIAVAKAQAQPGLGKSIPQRRLRGSQIVGQKRRQKIFAHHEVGDAPAFSFLLDLLGVRRAADGGEEQFRQLAAVVEIIPLAIIRSPADKEKINFRLGRRRPRDVLKRSVLGQPARQISVAADGAGKIFEGRRFAPVAPDVNAVPKRKQRDRRVEQERALDREIDIEDAVHRQNHQRRHDRKNVADAQIDENNRVEQKQQRKGRQIVFLLAPFAFERPREKDDQKRRQHAVEKLRIVVAPGNKNPQRQRGHLPEAFAVEQLALGKDPRRADARARAGRAAGGSKPVAEQRKKRIAGLEPIFRKPGKKREERQAAKHN